MTGGEGVTCVYCRADLAPSASVCPACGARRDPGSWRDQVRETVARHKEKKRLREEQQDDDARQLSIFPEEELEDPAKREIRERRAAIRARVEERVSRQPGSARPLRETSRSLDVGEIPLPRAGAVAAARELVREEEPEPADRRTDRRAAVAVPVDFEMPLAEAELEQGPEPVLAMGPASGLERVVAGGIDLIFVALIQLTLFYLTTHLVAQRVGALPRSALVAMGLVGGVMAAGYFLFFWSLSGQTLGKLLTGSRVVDRRGGALGFGRAALRLLATVVAALPLGVGFIGLWTDSERRGWHDRIAGTKVVRG
jgi:uncharacterized RDD family membrane protein YckC